MIDGKLERQDKVAKIHNRFDVRMKELFPELASEHTARVFDALEIETVRKLVLEKRHRIGGRGFDELRPLDAQVGILPRTHGSALFTRGETQALATVTLGTGDDVSPWTA